MKKVMLPLAVAAVLVAGAASAHAITITPDSGVLGSTRWQGDDNSQAAINAIILPIMAPFGATELYKNDNPAESGPLAGSYSAVLGDNDATITFDGGDYVGPTSFLLVKDGNASPNWYLFNLTAIFGWDGQEQLDIEGFFLDTDPRPGNQNGGGISHVTLYGTRDSGGEDGGTVPEPATLALFGTALALVGTRLRRRS